MLAFGLLIVGCGAREPAGSRTDVVGDPRAAFVGAYGSFQRGDYERALPVFTELTARYPAVADYALYFAGISAMRLGRNAPAEEYLSRLLRDYPQSVHVPRSQLALGRLFADGGRVEPARNWLQQALSAPDAATALQARLTLAEVDASSGDVAAAYAEFMTVRRQGIGSAAGRTAKQRIQTLRTQQPELVPTGADRLDEARLLVAEHDYAAAEGLAADVLSNPAGVDVAEVMRVRADAVYGEGRIDAALDALRELADQYPQSAAAPGALFRLASVLWNRDQDAAALPVFTEFCRRFPAAPQAAEALYAVGRIHQQAGRDGLASDAFDQLARRYPQSALAVEARWRIGWMRYLDGDWSQAAESFSQLAARTQGRDHNAAAYWSARALERMGRSAAARATYASLVDMEAPDYYSLWASQRLASPSLRTLSPIATATEPIAASEPIVVEAAPPTDTFHIPRAAELRAAGLYDLARGELSAAEREHRDDPLTLRYVVRAYPDVDGFAAAVRLVRRLDSAHGLSASERDRVLYPLAFWAAVQREAAAQAIDPLLVLAVMRQESLFDPEARSSANARGLMQLLPATAHRVARADPAVSEDDNLTRPERNIQLGVRYLRSLLDLFQGDTLKALAAYNGGENAVEKWERQFASLAADEFVECITFRETRDYVKRVIGNYERYRQLYARP